MGWLCQVGQERRKEVEGRFLKRDNLTLCQRETEVTTLLLLPLFVSLSLPLPLYLFSLPSSSLPPPSSSYLHLPPTCSPFLLTSEGVPSEHFTMVPMDSPEGAQLTVEALSSQIHQLQERVHNLVQQLNSLSLAVQGAIQSYGGVGNRSEFLTVMGVMCIVGS